jgi:D-alanyl-D-alanine carboxypeptidase
MNFLKFMILPICLLCGLSLTLCSCKGGSPLDPGSPYAQYVNTESNEYLVLLNKSYTSGEGYTPADLTYLPSDMTLYGKQFQLRLYAAKAAEALVLALHEQGYTDIVITSGYRSYSYQQSLFNTYIEQEMAAHPTWTEEQARQYVLTYSAAPGTSEHHTGNAIDLISTSNVVLDESFAQNPAYEWLQENAHYFGFILRYPADKTSITGYSYEPWHYRFVGAKAATEIHEQGLTLEEYLGAVN